MAMHAQNSFFNTPDIFFQVSYHLGVLFGHGIAHGIGNINRCSACLDSFFNYFRKEIEFGASSVFGAKFYIIQVAFSSFNTIDSPAYDFFFGHA